jgi:acyl-coenzyme A thioesterase PaaI-like protein
MSASVEQDWTGWRKWGRPDNDSYLAVIGEGYTRSDAPGKALVAVPTRNGHRNINGILHGGFLSGFADHAYFIGLGAMGRPEQIRGATVDLSMQFLGAGQIGSPLIAEVELLRETGRMMFLRLTIAQDGELIAASTATIRKASLPK